MSKHLLIFAATVSYLTLIPSVSAQKQATIQRSYISLSENVALIKENNTGKLLINNYLSSNTLEINSDRKIVSRSYSPFGNTLDDRRDVGDDKNDKRFTNHRKLDNLALYHAGARFYAPRIGQFIQPDLQEGPNRYAYVANNPIAFIDPEGKSALSILKKRVWDWMKASIHVDTDKSHTSGGIPRSFTSKLGSSYDTHLIDPQRLSPDEASSIIAGMVRINPDMDAESLTAQFQAGNYQLYYTADSSGQIVGYATVVPYKDNEGLQDIAYINKIHVGEAYRNQGLATSLLSTVEDHYDGIDLINIVNDDAIWEAMAHMYLRRGYTTSDQGTEFNLRK